MERQVNHTRDGKNYSGEDNFVSWDNPDNIISFETFIAIESVIYCYINPIIFCVGVPANVLNCVVFFRQGFSLKKVLLLYHHDHYNVSMLSSFSSFAIYLMDRR